MSTRGTLLLTVAAASLTVPVPAVAAPAATPAPATSLTVPLPAVAAPAATPAPATATRSATVTVRPALAGVPLLLHGRRYLTDATGRAVVPATDAELADKRALLRRSIRVPPTAISPRTHIRFSRWVGTTATVVLRRQVRVDLADPEGRPVDHGVAPVVVVRGSDGSQVDMPTGRRTWLTAIVPVPRRGSGWTQRPVSYAVREVWVHGTNVVQRGQQRIVPARSGHATIRALFFSIRLTSRDALLGAPRGREVVIRYPDGHEARRPLDARAGTVIDGLPRGNYRLTVVGPGLTSSQPVALSRTIDVRLRMITWLDVGLVAGVLGLIAIALPAIGRRRLRLLRRWSAPTRPVGGPPYV